jgi:hypothetical protein
MQTQLVANIPTQAIYNSAATIKQAKHYLAQGFAPIPVKYMDKAPTLSKWQQTTLCEKDLTEYFGKGAMNIGIVLGAR